MDFYFNERDVSKMYFNNDFRVINIGKGKYLAINKKSTLRSEKAYKLNSDIVKNILDNTPHNISSDELKKIEDNKIISNQFSDHRNVNNSTQMISSICFEIEGKCNLNCAHCYQSHKPISKLSTNQIFDIIDKITEAGCVFMQLTGGEIMLRNDFLKIYQYAIRKGLLLKISSNGTLLNMDIVDEFAKNPPYNLSISFYGTGREGDKTTRSKNYFGNFSKKIKLLKNTGILFDLKIILLRSNQKCYQEMIDFVSLYANYFHVYTNLIKCLDNQPTTKYSASDYYIKAAKIFNNRSGRIEKFMKKESCNAGYKSFAIDSKGDIVVCKLYRKNAISILENNFESVKLHYKKFLPSIFSKLKKCTICEKESYCTTCPIVMKSYLNEADKCFSV